MKKLIIACALLLVASTVMAQRGGEHMRQGPKARSERMAKMLDFTDDQNEELAKLNEKYFGKEFDRGAYRKDFEAIMTDAQKQKAADMTVKRTERMAIMMDFTDSQNAKLGKLNDRLRSDDINNEEYRQAVRELMTDEQKEKARAMRRGKGGMKNKRR